MSWSVSTALASFTPVQTLDFLGFSVECALSGTGQATDPTVLGSFGYDDTQWGAIPEGVLQRLAACAVQDDGEVVGSMVQLILEPVGDLNDVSGESGPRGGGNITAFATRMDHHGVLHTADANRSPGAGHAVGLEDALPWLVDGTHGRPFLYLLRPTSLLPASDNDADRTLWSPWELGVFHWGFTVSTPEVLLQNSFQVRGYAPS